MKVRLYMKGKANDDAGHAVCSELFVQCCWTGTQSTAEGATGLCQMLPQCVLRYSAVRECCWRDSLKNECAWSSLLLESRVQMLGGTPSAESRRAAAAASRAGVSPRAAPSAATKPAAQPARGAWKRPRVGCAHRAVILTAFWETHGKPLLLLLLR